MAQFRISEPIYFGGVDLNSVTGLMITGYDTFRYPSRELTSHHIAFTDKSVTSSAFYKERPINVRGVIRRAGRELLDESIGNLRKILHNVNQDLRIPIAGEMRDFYDTTVSNIGFSDIAGGYIGFDIEFATSDPHSYAISSTELLGVANLTSGNKSYPITMDGTAKQQPIITYIVDSVSNATGKTVTFTNPATSAAIAVQRTWTVGETLIINCMERTVQVDTADVEFTGQFPEWSPGVGHLNYTDEFTSRQVDLNFKYYKRYL